MQYYIPIAQSTLSDQSLCYLYHKT